jgi:hypothetical protein
MNPSILAAATNSRKPSEVVTQAKFPAKTIADLSIPTEIYILLTEIHAVHYFCALL